jgi:hypothetical protein
MNVASRWMIANIAFDDALILPHRANPTGLNFRERQDGQDLRPEPLETRKATLASLLRGCGTGLRLVEHLDHGGDVVYRHACKLGCG